MDSSEQLAFYDERYRANFERGMRDSYNFYDSYFRFVDARYSKLQGDGGRALDIGCGSGGVLKLLRERGYETFGLDFSEVAVNEIRSRNLAEVAVADVQEGIPFVGSYKLITAFEVIEHLYEPERALSHIRASLAPDGILLATSPCPGTVTHPSDVSIKSPYEWQEIMVAAGFRQVKARPVRYPPMLWRFHRRLGWLLPVPARYSHTVLYTAGGK